MGIIVDALIWDITHGGNVKSIEAALAYVNDTVGSPYLTQKEETVASIILVVCWKTGKKGDGKSNGPIYVWLLWQPTWHCNLIFDLSFQEAVNERSIGGNLPKDQATKNRYYQWVVAPIEFLGAANLPPKKISSRPNDEHHGDFPSPITASILNTTNLWPTV